MTIPTEEISSALGYYEYPNTSKWSRELQSFCQLQVEQLTDQSPIFWARIVYHDSLQAAHQQVTSYVQTQPPFSQDTLAYLKSEKWLLDFPHAFTVNQISLDNLTANCYICPFGYRNQKPEYIVVFAYEPLSFISQQFVKQSAILSSKYLDIYVDYGRQQAEVQLLEQILQRAGHQLRNPLALINLYAENL